MTVDLTALPFEYSACCPVETTQCMGDLAPLGADPAVSSATLVIGTCTTPHSQSIDSED